MTKKNAPAANGNESTKTKLKFTKQDAILNALTRRSLNTFEANREYGDTCLHTTVSTLRSFGHVIHDQWEEVRNRFGGTSRVKRYRLIRRAR